MFEMSTIKLDCASRVMPIELFETKEFRFNSFTLHAKFQKLNIYRVLVHSSVANLVLLLHVLG